MISITVTDNKVTGIQNGPSLPPGNIEINEAMRDTLKSLREQAASAGRDQSIEWNDGVPALVADSRLVVEYLVNGSANNVRVNVNTNFTVTVTATNDTGFNGSRVFYWFDRIFLINFTSGVGTKVISSAKSLEYKIGRTDDYNSNSITVQIVE